MAMNPATAESTLLNPQGGRVTPSSIRRFPPTGCVMRVWTQARVGIPEPSPAAEGVVQHEGALLVLAPQQCVRELSGGETVGSCTQRVHVQPPLPVGLRSGRNGSRYA